MANCTAPVLGHRDPTSPAAATCPVHGNAVAHRQAVVSVAPGSGAPARSLNDLVEFYTPFGVSADGDLDDHVRVNYVPSFIDGECESDDWEPVTGFSGQQGYSGPVMHNSEYLGGSMEKYVWENPGTYVIVESTYTTDPDGKPLGDDEELFSEGWVLLRKKDAPVVNGARPQSGVPQWVEGLTPGPRPKTVGSIIFARTAFSPDRPLAFRLDRFEVDDPRWPRGASQRWVSVDEPSVVVADHDVYAWMPSFFPDTEIGNLEHAIVNADRFAYTEAIRLEGEHNKIIAGMGQNPDHVRLASTVALDGTMSTTVYAANRDGSRNFAASVYRDADGVARVTSTGDDQSRRAQAVLEYMNSHAERIATWRDDMKKQDEVRLHGNRLRNEYEQLAGVRL